ncbi:CDP-glucose 4,6-dehydratase [Gammaproteobacteria bacterium]|nr:CDP-glucose 4,6-dehydratase [Gammaproteobacteria bacterium]
MVFQKFYKNKTVLVTGHTGFKGSWLTAWLIKLGANVIGVSLEDLPSEPSNFEVIGLENKIKEYRIDISDHVAVRKIIHNEKPDIIFHMAAQALVRPSYSDPIKTMITNAIGTISILDALASYKESIIAVLITSDKAYDNVEQQGGYKEEDIIGGKDPYSASKGMAELAIKGYFHSFIKAKHEKLRIGIARAGNVIGGGDWAKDRVVPDSIKAWADDLTVDIRSPNATRPWQHVLEPLSGYLTLALNLSISDDNNGQAYNFGPPDNQDFSVKDLIEEMKKNWSNVQWNDVSSDDNPHEAGLLKLNCEKALSQLEWKPTMNFEQTIKMTTDWYKEFYTGDRSNMYQFTLNQIDEYQKIAEKLEINWSIST